MLRTFIIHIVHLKVQSAHYNPFSRTGKSLFQTYSTLLNIIARMSTCMLLIIYTHLKQIYAPVVSIYMVTQYKQGFDHKKVFVYVCVTWKNLRQNKMCFI